ncbi:actin-like ATPase domain-containing protein [Teratosphaeria nubilosa]|uniref:Phosphotransferase n=1 Tax=Teratosphaeria nubilosa TaxID=161662 RepID=A0A6G1L5B1_9PEZI|nr:actin-like ATPase domain-containing protein [Teratosphaeria nubilosa]
MEAFAAEVRSLFEAPLREGRLLEMSRGLQEEYREKLRESEVSMLPSYQHTLPTGKEQGDFLALDVGGSTFRLALVRLGGSVNMDKGTELQVRRMKSFVIDKNIRDLRGQAFFDWMADRIGDMLAEYNHINGTTDARLDMGLAWSFPIEQTSPQSGRLQPMGKGFRASQGIEGQDLSEIIMRSCRRRSLNVNLKAIVNDGQATLLSQAYKDPATRMSLILGTGTNAAVFMPVTALGSGKFGQRPESWHATAQHVLINTEMSMFGKHVLPTTRWDEELNMSHILPDFQPLEYLITGRYLGEIVRLIVVEAVRTVGLFDGEMPRGLDEPYSLDTRILASLHGDTSPQLAKGQDAFLQAHPLPSRPRQCEFEFLREVAISVSRRAAKYLAVALHALWTVRTEAEGLQTDEASHITIACDGTIVAKYPDFRTCCQRYLDELCELSGASRGAVTLELATESSIFGAAVASCCLGDT